MNAAALVVQVGASRMIRRDLWISESRHGAKQPELTIAMPGASTRRVRAAMHIVAAIAEELTDVGGERWIVNVTDDGNGWDFKVWIELANDTEAEAEAGLEVLHQVAKAVGI